MEAGFVFVDRGIDNQTSSQIAARFDAHIRPLQPDIIVLQMCINDLKTIPLFPDARNEIIENCKANIDQIIDNFRAIGAAVILTTIFPFGELPPERRLLWSGNVFQSLEQLNSYIQSLAGDGVVVLDAFSILADENGRVQEQYRFEFLHINRNGYDALNNL